MAVDIRSQIFELRRSGGSHRTIARQLGISPSKVKRELDKRAPEVRAERGEQLDDVSPTFNSFHAGVDVEAPIGLGGDPLLAEERQQVERERLQLQRAQIRSQRLEAERRAQLLEHPDASGQGNGLVALILQTMERMRDDNRALLERLASRQVAPAATPAPTLTEQLSQWRQIGETMQSFSPPKAPSSAVDLEFKVAMERLNLEERRTAQQLETDRAERQERAASEARRNDAVAKAIEQFAPAASAAIEHWFAQQQQADPALPQLPAAAGEGAARHLAPPPPAAPQGEVTGQCPNCQVALGLSGERDERCPACGTTLVVAEGRIRARLPNGELWPPLQSASTAN